MSVDRPTYHESWYRIAPTRPRLRSLVQSFRQRYRGKTWHVLRDPSANKFFRLHEASYRFVAMLDGERTVEQAWQAVDEDFGDDAPTQGEVIQLLGQLYVSNLLTGEVPPDSQGLYERYRKRVRKEVGGYLMNILFTRIPVWDPNILLNRWEFFTNWMFGPFGIALWLVMLSVGVYSLAGRWGDLIEASQSVLHANNLFTLYLATFVAKIIHELGHGFACKRFGRGTPGGGEVHTIGVMLIALIPMPYVDASSAWAFRNKWHRAFVGAAGMYFELALAAIAAVVWSSTSSDAWINQFAYNMMFIAGVSTVLFNGNALIKFDGYYILSDVIEMPNLQQRSQEMFRYLWKKFIYGLKRPHQPAHSLNEAIFLLFYFVAALIYKVFITIAILIFVAQQLFFIGMVMAVAGIVAMVITPCVKFVHYLLSNAELERYRAIVTSMIAVGLAIALISWPKIPDYGRAQGVVEATHLTPIYASVDGQVQQAVMPLGRVDGDQHVLIQMENPRLVAVHREARAHLSEVAALGRRAIDEEPAAAVIYHEQYAAAQETEEQARGDVEDLTIHAPHGGLWVPGPIEEATGFPVKKGELLGYVLNPEVLEIHLAASQYVGPRIAAHAPAGTQVELRARGRPDQTLTGVVTQIIRAGQRELPSEALGFYAGGEILTEQNQQGGQQATQSYFRIIIEPTEEDAEQFAELMRPGQRVVARFRWPDATILQQVYLAARQMLQEQLQI